MRYSLGVRWAGDWLVSTGEDPDSETSGAKCCPTLGTLVVMSSPLTKGLYPLMADHSQSWIPKMQNSLLVWAKTICGVVSQKMENFSPRNDFFSEDNFFSSNMSSIWFKKAHRNSSLLPHPLVLSLQSFGTFNWGVFVTVKFWVCSWFVFQR